MKKILTILTIATMAVYATSCSKEETTTTTTTTTTNTWVSLTVVGVGSTEPKPGYTVLMFETTAHQTPPTQSSPPVPKNPLPTILREVVSNAQGVAHFDLNSLVTSSTPKTYYFIAVKKEGTSYIWETPFQQREFAISRGSMITSSITAR